MKRHNQGFTLVEMLCTVVILLLVFAMSMQNITFLVKVQAFCLFANIATTLLTAVLVLTSGHWSISNLAGMFNFSNIETTGGIPGWIIGMALLITPYFGFETVPQMVEEGDFPISNTKKAIAKILLNEGYIKAVDYVDDGLQGSIKITLKYVNGKQTPVINGLKRISKPGLRVYARCEELPKVLGGLGIAIVSTSKGLMTDKEARKNAMGGEVLAYIW